MTKTERVKAARERLATAKQAIVDLNAKRAKDDIARKAGQKKLDKFRHPVLFRRPKDTSTPELYDAIDIKPGYWGGGDTPTEKTLRESIEAGTTKVEFSRGGYGSTQRSAKSMAQGLRTMTRADVSKLRSLDRRIEKLRDQREQLLNDAYDRGLTSTTADVARFAARLRFILKSIPNAPFYGGEDWDMKRAETSVAEAETHLAYAKGERPRPDTDDPEVCPCNPCHWERREQGERDKEAARVAALPTAMVSCVGCGKRHRVHVDRSRQNITTTIDGVERVIEAGAPVWRCDGKLMLYTDLWRKENAAAEKARAKLLREQGITWLCPTCEGEHTTLIETEYYNGDADFRYVECEFSEQTFPIGEIRITKNKKRAELPAESEAA